MQISKNKVVTIEYIITDEQNKVIDSSKASAPFSYIHKIGKCIPGLESALEGKSTGDSFTVSISPEEGYGERNESLIFTIPKKNFDGIGVDNFQPGMQFQARDESGIKLLTVVQFDGDTVTVDSNHPLAGVTANFNVTIKDVRDATREELIQGHVHNQGCSDDCKESGSHDDCSDHHSNDNCPGCDFH